MIRARIGEHQALSLEQGTTGLSWILVIFFGGALLSFFDLSLMSSSHVRSWEPPETPTRCSPSHQPAALPL